MFLTRKSWILYAVSGGICFGVSSCVVNFGILSLAGIALLGAAAAGPHPFIAVALWSALAYSIGTSWMIGFGAVPWLALAAWHCLGLLGCALGARLGRSVASGSAVGWIGNALTVGGLFAGAEVLRGIGPLGVSMVCASGPVADNTLLRQLGSVTGAVGISTLVAVAGVGIGTAALVESRARLRLGAVAAVVVVAHIAGAALLLSPDGSSKSIRVSALQGVTEDGFQRAKENERAVDVYLGLATVAANAGAKLAVWPETSHYPGNLCIDEDEQMVVAQVCREFKLAQIVGTICETQSETEAMVYNTALGFGADGRIEGAYDKVRLTPFGEFVPMREVLPPLDRWGVTETDYTVGRDWPLLELAGVRIGVLICSETMFADLALTRTRAGAELIAVMSNDSWFGRGPGVLQLRWLSVIRAVECGRPIVRAAETGYSMIIDAKGRTLARSGLYKRQAITGDVRLGVGSTLYDRTAHIWPWLPGMGILIGLAMVAYARLRN